MHVFCFSTMSRRQVNDDDIEKILRELEDGNVSEDGREDEDDDEENFYANAQQLVQDLVSLSSRC